MRSFLIATGVLVLAAYVQAQSANTATTTAADTTATAPPLIKSVIDDPNDSPMVRAAKRAVASRQNAGQRRVVTLASPGAATRGRVAIASGPAVGPKLPPPQPDAAKADAPKVITAQERVAARRQAEVQEKLKQLKNEEERIAAELDEEHPEMDEDMIDKRLAEIEAERKKLLQSTPPPGI